MSNPESVTASGSPFASWHRVWLVAAMLYATVHLIVLRNADVTPLLLFVLPPISACILLASPKRGAFTRFACRVFLFLVGAAILVGEQPAILPNLRLAFPGIPVEQNRVLTLYLLVYMFFCVVLLPPFVFSGSIHAISKGKRCSISKGTCAFGLIAWLIVMLFLAIGVPELMK